MKKALSKTLEIPEGVQARFQNNSFTVKGPKGELMRVFDDPWLQIKIEGNTITAHVEKATKREKAKLFTQMKHMANMLKGVVEPMKYKLKICSGHFPMNVSLHGKKFSVKNFLGEKIPRNLDIRDDVDVKLEGDMITVTAPDIEAAGQVAGRLEKLTRITNRDLRIFQDGIYIIEKPQK